MLTLGNLEPYEVKLKLGEFGGGGGVYKLASNAMDLRDVTVFTD